MKTQKELKRNRRKGVKVVYISSPMKVKTSAAKFRALVQELTGINSDAERFIEMNGVGDNPDDRHSHAVDHDQDQDQRLMMQSMNGVDEDSRHQSERDNDHFSYLSMINTNGFGGDFPDYSSLFQLQTFGNDQRVFS
ncbi:VQ motif containing protein [Parasponia andersonii]|uniref:VQ motif containing protein n=1 Tax=Parasponia andersonii TaxID=3476 RepID=A0A2P5BX06_PARAD|nr:VQ motif containing protein [Parasponia andersonii]